MKMGKKSGEVPGLYETEDGYAVRVFASSGSVKIEKAKKLPGASKAEALIVLGQLKKQAEIEAQARDRGEATTTTLTACALSYAKSLAQRQAKGHVKPKTTHTHVKNLEEFILPFLGRIEVRELKPKDIVGWMRWVETLETKPERRARGKKTYAAKKRPYARATLMRAWRTLRAFCSWLTIEYDLPRNPARDVRFDAVGQAALPKVTLNRAELGALFEAAKQESLANRAMLMVATVGAMRASEVSALEWSDVDLAAGTVTINRSRSMKHVGAPKTVGSRRVVVLPPEVAQTLMALRAAEPEATVMFRTTRDTPHTPETISYVLARVAKRAGITKHVTSHCPRRTANNLLRKSAGELVARAVTGHTTQAMTEHYSDVDREERTEALRSAFGDALDDDFVVENVH